MIKVKNRVILYIVIGLTALLVVGGIIVFGGNFQVESPAELLSLGEQYLLDLDYEQALVQFLKVIEIEPMNERAYLGAAEAYIGLGQADEAIAILEQGIAATDSEDMRARLLELTGVEDNTEPIEESQSTEESAPVVSESEDYMPTEIVALFEQAAEAFQSEDYDTLQELINNDTLSDFLEQNDNKYYNGYADELNYAKYRNVTGAYYQLEVGGRSMLTYINVDDSGTGYGRFIFQDWDDGCWLEKFDITQGVLSGMYEKTLLTPDLRSNVWIYEKGPIVNGVYEGTVEYIHRFNNPDIAPDMYGQVIEGTATYSKGYYIHTDGSSDGTSFAEPAFDWIIDMIFPLDRPDWNVAE